MYYSVVFHSIFIIPYRRGTFLFNRSTFLSNDSLHAPLTGHRLHKRRSASHNIQLAERLSKHPTLIYFLSVSPLFHPQYFRIAFSIIFAHLFIAGTSSSVNGERGQSCRPISIPWIRRISFATEYIFPWQPVMVKIISLTAC